MQDLRKLAEAATPGPWKAGGKSVRAAETDDKLGMDCRLFGGEAEQHRKNARYIAACSPDRILAMLDALDVLRSILDDGLHCDVVPHLHRQGRAALAALEKP